MRLCIPLAGLLFSAAALLPGSAGAVGVGIGFPFSFPLKGYDNRMYPMLGYGMEPALGFGRFLELKAGATMFPHFTRGNAAGIGHIDIYEFRGLCYLGPNPTAYPLSLRAAAGWGRAWSDLARLVEPAAGTRWNDMYYFGGEVSAIVAKNVSVGLDAGVTTIRLAGRDYHSLRVEIGGTYSIGGSKK
jgi:hypothetical protein